MTSIIQAFFFLFSFCLFVYTESSVIKIRSGSSRDATFIPSWYSDMQVMQAAFIVHAPACGLAMERLPFLFPSSEPRANLSRIVESMS